MTPPRREPLEKGAAQRVTRPRTPYLVFLLLGETCLFLYLLRLDPMAMWRLHETWHSLWHGDPHKERERRLGELMKNDLPLGSRAPLIEQTAVNGGEQGKPVKPTLLVFVGACTSCMEPHLWKWQRVQEQCPDLHVLLVSQDTPENVRAFLHQSRMAVPILPDPDGAWARAYNAVWLPRAYGIDRAGRIVWMQKRLSMNPPQVALQISDHGKRR